MQTCKRKCSCEPRNTEWPGTISTCTTKKSPSRSSLLFGALQKNANNMATTRCLLCVSVQDLRDAPTPCCVSTTRRRSSTTQRGPTSHTRNIPRTHSTVPLINKTVYELQRRSNFCASKGLSCPQTRQEKQGRLGLHLPRTYKDTLCKE
ncbi:unnamed protein product [Ectocarpus sp. 12 AP-2014]